MIFRFLTYKEHRFGFGQVVEVVKQHACGPDPIPTGQLFDDLILRLLVNQPGSLDLLRDTSLLDYYRHSAQERIECVRWAAWNRFDGAFVKMLLSHDGTVTRELLQEYR